MNGMRGTSTLAIVILLAACTTMPPPVPTDWSATATASAGFSGAGANATARSNAGGTTVNVAFREAAGMSGTVRPWHVHYGSCGNDQGIVGDANAYPALRPGSDGTVTTSATISVPLEPGRGYFVNIHKSPAELQTIVACGALTTPAMGMASASTGAMVSSGYGTTSTSEAKMIHVSLNEYRIDLPDPLPAGRVMFHVMNAGGIPHSFGIRSSSGSAGYGTGGTTAAAYERSLPSPLQPGQMATLEVELQPGSYVTFCPVGDHVSAHGMTKTVTVK